MNNKGFTLLELMLSIALGLIILSAALIIFITGHRSYLMQQGSSDLQDNANFGLNYIVHDIRFANLNNPRSSINSTLNLGGIVISQANVPVQDGLSSDYLSKSATGPSVVMEGSGSSLKSDVLVIQYKPVVAGIDCEGSEIKADGSMVIQRYYLREDSNAESTEPSKLALVCDAGRYIENKKMEGLGLNSQVIMKRVEYFRVLLEVVNLSQQTRFMDIVTYNAQSVKPRIVAVSIGVLARSPSSVGAYKNNNSLDQYKVLDKTVKENSNTNSTRYIRQVITQHVALRNGLGDREQDVNEK